MKHFKSWRNNRVVSSALRSENDPIVQNGLSVTPAEMMQLTKAGFAIGAQNARMLAEVKSMAVGDVPLEYRRGFDMADGYQAMMSVHQKAHKLRDGLVDGSIRDLFHSKTD